VSYVSEPYAQFVDDLLTALTGGVIREQFVFLRELAPFRLSPPGPVVKTTLRVFGQADAAFREFRRDRDYTFTADSSIEWKARRDGTPAADAQWPDEGTFFYVNYDHRGPAGAAPLLSDRNPGSVTRLLAESLAREFAVLSRQLESVYQSGFLATATGRDLDQLVALVGVTRLDHTFASGSVVFTRSTPAAADVFIPAGTRLSTGQPPLAVFETTEDATLHRGSLSAEVPVRAVVGGPAGVVAAGAITVIHRPIFGIESVANPQATQLAAAAEADDSLRARARRALEAAGRSTVGAIVGALATLPGVREKDVRVDEDHIKRPGVITISVAAPLDSDGARRALDLIEASRPAGVRVLHNLDDATMPGTLTPGDNTVDDEEPPPDATAAPGALFLPVVVAATLLPASGSMSTADKRALATRAENAIRAFAADAGIGETLVYNRLVAELMALDGVLDVTLELYDASIAPAPTTRHRNLTPGATLRATVDETRGGAVAVEVGGQIVMLDITVAVVLKGAGALGDATANLEAVRLHIAAQLRAAVASLSSLSAAALKALIVADDTFDAGVLTFAVEYLDAGVRVNKVFGAGDAPLPLSTLQRPWVRRVTLGGA
jgi:uncharacterized phage protein gp47/JayE